MSSAGELLLTQHRRAAATRLHQAMTMAGTLPWRIRHPDQKETDFPLVNFRGDGARWRAQG